MKSQERLGRAIQEVSSSDNKSYNADATGLSSLSVIQWYGAVMIAKLFTENSLISRLCWRQKMAALNNHTVLFFVSLRAADLSHLCDAKLVLWDCCCSTDVASPPCASWPMMKEPVPPVGPRHEFCVCVCICVCVCMCTASGWEGSAGRYSGNVCVGKPRKSPLSWTAEAQGRWAATHSSAIRTSEVVGGLGC